MGGHCEMKRLLIFLLLFIALVLSGCSITEKAKQAKDSVLSFKESMQAYWACMDGCLFMQKIHEEKYGLNMTKEDHDICAAMCWSKYGGG